MPLFFIYKNMNINISLSKYGDELTINVSVPTDVEYADVTIDKIAINDNSKYTVEYPISPRIEISGSASGEFVLTNNKSYSKTFQIQTLIDNGLSATGLYFIYIKLNGDPTIVIADFKKLEVRHVHNLINVYKYIIFEINKKYSHESPYRSNENMIDLYLKKLSIELLLLEKEYVAASKMWTDYMIAYRNDIINTSI